MQAEKEPSIEQDAHVARLLDVGELASLWRVSPHTIRAWVKAKRLKPTRICRRLLFHPEECARFVAAGNRDRRISKSLACQPTYDSCLGQSETSKAHQNLQTTSLPS